MGRKDLRIVGKRQQLLMNALVHDRGELLWRVGRREIRPAHIANEERVSGEDGGGPIRLAAIVHQNANAFEGMSRSLQEAEAALPELDLVSVLHRDVRELSAGSRAEIDVRASALRKFAMSRDEVGMDVSLDDVFDLPPIASCRFEIDIHIALGIDDGCDALRRQPCKTRGPGSPNRIAPLVPVPCSSLLDYLWSVYCGCATTRR